MRHLWVFGFGCGYTLIHSDNDNEQSLTFSMSVLFCLQIIRYRYFDRRRHDPPGGEVIRIGGLKGITLSKDSLELLPVHTYIDIVEEKADTKEYDTCAICIEHFVARESEVRKLPCGHIFHVECVGKCG